MNCSKCGSALPSSRAHYYCKSCLREYDRVRNSTTVRKKLISDSAIKLKRRNKLFVLDYLRSHPCVDCGESDPVVLSFDHQRDKVKALSHMVENSSIETLLAEIAKCQVRCMNCHAKKTARERNSFKHQAGLAQLVERVIGNDEVSGS